MMMTWAEKKKYDGRSEGKGSGNTIHIELIHPKKRVMFCLLLVPFSCVRLPFNVCHCPLSLLSCNWILFPSSQSLLVATPFLSALFISQPSQSHWRGRRDSPYLFHSILSREESRWPDHKEYKDQYNEKNEKAAPNQRWGRRTDCLHFKKCNVSLDL